MVDAIGAVGPVIVVLCIAIGVLTLIRDGGDIGLDWILLKMQHEGAEWGNN